MMILCQIVLYYICQRVSLISIYSHIFIYTESRHQNEHLLFLAYPGKITLFKIFVDFLLTKFIRDKICQKLTKKRTAIFYLQYNVDAIKSQLSDVTRNQLMCTVFVTWLLRKREINCILTINNFRTFSLNFVVIKDIARKFYWHLIAVYPEPVIMMLSLSIFCTLLPTIYSEQTFLDSKRLWRIL